MNNSFGQHGWKEFHRNRKNIIAEYDKLIEQTSNRPVHTAHGPGVEAYIRNWLSSFLPKKFGVTSGYIIPTTYNDTLPIYHYDIIIYNIIDAPVLWIEGNEDDSEQGKYRAIPAQHVLSVYEVKSRLTKSSADDAIAKLRQAGQFRDYLNKNYSCGMIYIDLKEKDNNKKEIIKALHTGMDVFGMRGGTVLRYEGDVSVTGWISFWGRDATESRENVYATPLAKPIDELNIYLQEDGNLVLGDGCSAMFVDTGDNAISVSKRYVSSYVSEGYEINLSWSRSNFAEFFMDFLRALEGLPYLLDDRDRPTFGRVFDRIERKKAPVQSGTPRRGFPFITVSLHNIGNDEVSMIREEGGIKIEFCVELLNEGDAEARVSDDGFKTEINLSAGEAVVKSLCVYVKHDGDEKPSINVVKMEGLQLPYRLVYQTVTSEKEFFAVEKVLQVAGSEIRLIDA